METEKETTSSGFLADHNCSVRVNVCCRHGDFCRQSTGWNPAGVMQLSSLEPVAGLLLFPWWDLILKAMCDNRRNYFSLGSVTALRGGGWWLGRQKKDLRENKGKAICCSCEAALLHRIISYNTGTHGVSSLPYRNIECSGMMRPHHWHHSTDMIAIKTRYFSLGNHCF